MKIKSLTIHNIASIADAHIDFDSPELSKSDIFLIAGDTGAGKSTILDCICLALYNTAPRLKSTLMEGRLEQKGDYNGISLSDPRQLLRRNTGEGFAELLFEGNNGRVYTARWYAQRAYCRPGGRLQKVIHSFSADGQTYVGDSLREERSAAVGVTYEEFVRTTMLAQGEFTRFLNCTDKEKSEVLMQILNVDDYAKISRRIHQRTAEEKDVLERLKMKADSLDLLAPERKQELDEEKAALKARSAELRKAHDADTARLRWFTDLEGLRKALADAETSLHTVNDVAKSDEYVRDEKFITSYDASGKALSLVREAFDKRKQLKANRIELFKLRGEIAAANRTLALMETQLLEKEAEIRKIEEYFNRTKPIEPTIERYMLVSQNVKNYYTAEYRLKTNADELTALSLEQKRIASAREVAAAQLKTAGELLSNERQQATALAEKLKAKNPDGLRRRETELATRAGALALAQSHARNHKTLSEELAASVKEADRLRVSIAETAEAVKKAEADVVEKAAVLESRRKIYEKASTSLSDWSRRMRSELTVGDTCPVCRRKIEEHFESDDEILRSLQPLKADIEECERKHRDAVELHNTLRVELASRTKLMQAAQAETERRRAQVDDIATQLSALCSTLGIETSEIGDAAQKCADEREALKPELAEAAALGAKCEEQRGRVDAATHGKEEAEASLRTVERTLANLDARKATLETLVASEKATMEKSSSELAADVTGAWKFSWRDEPKAFLAELEAAVAERRQAERQNEALGRERERLAAAVATCHAASAAVGRMMSCEAVEIPEFRPVPRLESEFPALAARTEANLRLQNELSAKISELKVAINEEIKTNGVWSLTSLCRALRKSAEEIQSVRSKVEKTKNDIVQARAVCENLRRRSEAHLQARPDMVDGDSAETVALRINECAAELNGCVARLAVIDETLRNDAALRHRLAGIFADIEKQKAVLADWQQLDGHFGSADGSRFGKIALRYVLGHLLDKANIYLQRIMPRYRLHCRPDSFIIMVEDAYQNGAMRSANIISGGESFIVSLVLALALSDVETHLKVDILFIDEGFGALSGDALEGAVETLRTLHSYGGRRVGIISHVAELRERIPAKILVKREGQGASSVNVVLS